jgi:ATP-dependent metalloprotease FtsH
MFTTKAEQIVATAKDLAASRQVPTLELVDVLATLVEDAEASVLLADCLGCASDALVERFPPLKVSKRCHDKLPLSEAVRGLLKTARSLANEAPDRVYPGLIGVRHLVAATATSAEACALLRQSPIAFDAAVTRITEWYQRDAFAPRLDELPQRLRQLRAELLACVVGQDHAIHAFVEGLFNAEVVAAADAERKRPRALFVFAGPPGVGKTYLAELGAAQLGRPFKRFDMSAYAGHEMEAALVGMAKSYRGAHAGQLTEFVEKHPEGVLLFDEIEKAHLNTIHLFLQILDAGRLEDKYHERDVAFRDTTIIFTTNVGRKLYDRPEAHGIHGANAAFHRKTILDAIEHEHDPRTGQPFFPAAICSRMATGYPLLFNHLGVNELQRVVRAELSRVAGLLQLQYFKRVTFDELLPMCLVLKEGARADARTLCSQAATFLKTELFKFCHLFTSDRLEEVFGQFDRIHLTLDQEPHSVGADVAELFDASQRPQVLMIADGDLTDLYCETIPEIDWHSASTADDALEILARSDVTLVLLDLWVGRSLSTPLLTLQQFDHAPAAARGLDRGQEILHKIRERASSVPVYLLSLAESESDTQGSIDEELFLACVRGGGSRGMIVSSFFDPLVKNWQEQRDRFVSRLQDICRHLYREKSAGRLGHERKVLSFETVPRIDHDDRSMTIGLRNLRVVRAIAAADAGEVLEDIERPRTKFDDVSGAEMAKDELKFFIDYLRNPRRFAALGLKPPKGVLLHGPPGTGKTMLARAMAGESNVAFLSASASSFVTVWQGSGRQNIRDLFARARRYAPAIVFIDEIDAIGKTRAGSAGAGQAEENTLNALLTEMDGFTSPSADRPVFVLAATNFNVEGGEADGPTQVNRTLDPALVRRFARAILVGLPERHTREKYLGMRLANRPACHVSPQTVALIAERSSGMSIANLESIIETAARVAAKSESDLTDTMLEDAFETVRFGEARPRSPEVVKRTACHEAGHTLLYWASGYWPPYVTVVSRGDHGGYMARSTEEIERRASQTRDELLADIRVALAGRAAEITAYGPIAGLSTGASSDLEHATRVARQIVCRFGMDDDFGLLATPEVMKYEGALSSPAYVQINDASRKVLKEEMDKTLAFLTEKRSYLDAVTDALAERERLTTEELRQILPEKVGQGGAAPVNVPR